MELETLAWIILGAATFIWSIAMHSVAPLEYGKTAVIEKKGKEKIWKIPARLHWRIPFCMAYIVPPVVVKYTDCQFGTNIPNLIAMAMYTIHYINRGIIYPFKIPKNAEPVPISMISFGIFFIGTNTFLQFYYLLNKVDCSLGYCSSHPIIWVIIWAAGFSINYYHDAILCKFKGEGKGYQIPKGGLFNYVSSAHYLGEIVEFWAFAMVTKSSPSIIFSIWSTNFLIGRAIVSHNFYKARFGDKYPKDRKAIIPFLL